MFCGDNGAYSYNAFCHIYTNSDDVYDNDEALYNNACDSHNGDDGDVKHQEQEHPTQHQQKFGLHDQLQLAA